MCLTYCWIFPSTTMSSCLLYNSENIHVGILWDSNKWTPIMHQLITSHCPEHFIPPENPLARMYMPKCLHSKGRQSECIPMLPYLNSQVHNSSLRTHIWTSPPSFSHFIHAKLCTIPYLSNKILTNHLFGTPFHSIGHCQDGWSVVGAHFDWWVRSIGGVMITPECQMSLDGFLCKN